MTPSLPPNKSALQQVACHPGLRGPKDCRRLRPSPAQAPQQPQALRHLRQ